MYRAPTIKQHLAAIRRLFDWLVLGQVISWNPAAAVRGPTHVVKKGKTPVLEPAEVRLLLDSIDMSAVGDLRDRALLGVMIYSFARVSAVVNINVEDYYPQGKRWWWRLREKGGKYHAVPVHHKAKAYLEAYLETAGTAAENGSPLWRSLMRTRELGEHRMSRVDVFRMIKRRVKAAALGGGSPAIPPARSRCSRRNSTADEAVQRQLRAYFAGPGASTTISVGHSDLPGDFRTS